MQFKVGDSVVFKNGTGVPMMVERVQDGLVHCTWWDEVKGKRVTGRDAFVPEILTLHQPTAGFAYVR